MRYFYFSAIPHPDGDRLLMLRRGDGWTLPRHKTAQFHFWQEVYPEHCLLKETLDIEGYTLRLIWADWSQENKRALYLYARTPPPPGWEPPAGAMWMDVADLPSLDLDPPDLGAGIAAWQRWNNDGPAGTPLPWSDPDWYGRATAWIEAQLDTAGLTQTGPHIQRTSRPRGTVFKTTTDGGAVYFKAVSRMFAHEPGLSERLGQWFPDTVPPLMAADADELWYVGKEVPGRPLAEVADIASWQDALRRYGCLQAALAGRLAEVRAVGCPEAFLPTYVAEVRRLIEAEAWGLTRTEFAPLLERLPRLEGLCRDLYESPLPLTVDHGDFSPWQILVAGERIAVLDWSDSAIAHPFFSLSTFWEALEYLQTSGPPPVQAMLADLDAAKDACANAYLEAWADTAPLSRLKAYLELAQELAPLHTALKFVRFLKHGIDTQWDMDGAVPMYLKRLL